MTAQPESDEIVQLSAAAQKVDAQPAAGEVSGSLAHDDTLVTERKSALSRSVERRSDAVATNTAVTRWATTALNLWSTSSDAAKQVGEIDRAEKVKATGREVNGRVEVVVDGTTRWVTEGHLAKKKPAAVAPAAPVVSDAACANSSVESGLKANTVKLYRSLCAAFPEVTTYGGMAGRVEHNTGNAIDVMVYNDKALGDRIAAWTLKNAATFDLYDIIWYQRIWTPVRSSEGWRQMASRGGATANHIDHVHIGTNP